jgi:hypothetical protein
VKLISRSILRTKIPCKRALRKRNHAHNVDLHSCVWPSHASTRLRSDTSCHRHLSDAVIAKVDGAEDLAHENCSAGFVRLSAMPQHLMELLWNVCPSCCLKGDVVWRNLRRDDTHFEAFNKYFEKGHTHKKICFLTCESLLGLLSSASSYISNSIYPQGSFSYSSNDSFFDGPPY